MGREFLTIRAQFRRFLRDLEHQPESRRRLFAKIGADPPSSDGRLELKDILRNAGRALSRLVQRTSLRIFDPEPEWIRERPVLDRLGTEEALESYDTYWWRCVVLLSVQRPESCIIPPDPSAPLTCFEPCLSRDDFIDAMRADRESERRTIGYLRSRPETERLQRIHAYANGGLKPPRMPMVERAAMRRWRLIASIDACTFLASLERQATPKEVPRRPAKRPSNCTHSRDFVTAVWYGTSHTFTKSQADCVKLLWEEWENGTPGLSEKTIGEAIGSNSDRFRLLQVFRSKRGVHQAWNTMIRSVGKGIFGLVDPKRQ